MSTLRERLHELVDAIADAVEKSSADEWIDQRKSPLGREKHLALVKAGKLPAVKEGRQVLVRRSDLDAYLARHKVIAVDPRVDEEHEIARVIEMANRGSR